MDSNFEAMNVISILTLRVNALDFVQSSFLLLIETAL